MNTTHILGTSLDQAEFLVQIGLDPNTADMHYSNARAIKEDNPDLGLQLSLTPYSEVVDMTDNLFFRVVPAWSTAKMYEILKKKGRRMNDLGKYSPDGYNLIKYLVCELMHMIQNY